MNTKATDGMIKVCKCGKIPDVKIWSEKVSKLQPRKYFYDIWCDDAACDGGAVQIGYRDTKEEARFVAIEKWNAKFN